MSKRNVTTLLVTVVTGLMVLAYALTGCAPAGSQGGSAITSSTEVVGIKRYVDIEYQVACYESQFTENLSCVYYGGR
jgi:hypothetical protein